MCGRFTQFAITKAAEALQVEAIDEAIDLPPRYNIAPAQTVAAIAQLPENDQRQWLPLRWGLIPSWAKDLAIGYKLINARSETVAEKPSFRSAFKHRRCLIPTNGFYEWQHLDGSKKKQPYFISLQNDDLFTLAGLWERWESLEGDILETCTILTTTANELVSPIHDRMPVILQPQDYDQWLDPNFKQADKLQELLKPYSAKAMQAYPVSIKVNSPKNDSPECSQRLE
ncbi:MAG: SOS response-associated peptidase [Coleofasciculaceae cyanobacterium SM2_1_6]|nr:SOS response-associated peptidase [Coleofasciculaceae cyanobacterium SM2_1_6]